MAERLGYGFSNIDKEMVHKRANGNCEHIDCGRTSNGIVHHLEGCFIARLDDKTKSSISDPDLNALKLCDPHTLMLDIQQKEQVDNLIYESKKIRNRSNKRQPRRQGRLPRNH